MRSSSSSSSSSSSVRGLIFILVSITVNLLVSHHLPALAFPTHPGGSFGRGSWEPKYKLEFHSEDSPFHPDNDQESVIMPNKNGQKFLCYLPKVEKTKGRKPVAQQNTSSVIVETDDNVKMKTPDQLLDALQELCLIRQEGWWSYEFCYNKKLRQVHIENDKVVLEYSLGTYDPEATANLNQNLPDVSTVKDPRSKDASQRYHAHLYTNGTICDLTNQPRETEVRFVCAESRAMITSISEVSTCKYALTVQCPTLCKHPLFEEERPVWHTINCNAPKDYKKPKVEEHITLLRELGYASQFESE